ncbi:hypothetical protein BH09SUM1_BH09SUM1_23910 [soil metagenome]
MIRRWRLALEAAICAILVIAFYHPLLRFGSIQSGGDSANLFWPIKILIQESWHRGEVPLWNPYSFMGAPLAASLQHAVFYPPDWLIYGIFPAHIGLNLENLLHLSLAAVGTFLWLRVGQRLSSVVAICCGAAFPCCAWFWGQIEHVNQVASASWLPMLAFISWQFIQGRISPRIFAISYGLAAALQFMTGHPQEAFYSQLFCAVLFIGKLIVSNNRFDLFRNYFRGGILAIILMALLIGVQLAPMLELSGYSRRQFNDPSYAISFSMPPDLLKTYLSPHYFGSFRDGYYVENPDGTIAANENGAAIWNRRAYSEYGLFVGIPILLLAIAGVFFRGHRKCAAGLGVIIVVSILLALGANTRTDVLLSRNFAEFTDAGLFAPHGYSLHELFMTICPPAKGFRVPARIAIMAAFCWVTLAAFGLEQFRNYGPLKNNRNVYSAALGTTILLALYLPSQKEKFHFPAPIKTALDFPKITELANSGINSRIFRLTLSDDDSLVNERHFESTFANGNPIFARMGSLQPHMNVVAHAGMVDGYEEGLVPTARMKDFLYEFNRNFRQFHPDAQLLALLGVKYIVSDLPVDESFYRQYEARLLDHFKTYENPAWSGAAFPAERAAGIDFARLDGPFWRGGAPLPMISSVAVDYGRAEKWMEKPPPLKAEVDGVNRVVVNGPADSADAILAMGWYPGWVFKTGSGGAAEFISAVHMKLPKGAADSGAGTTWRIAFEPFSYRLGLFMTCIGIAAWIFAMRLKPRDRRSAATRAA